MNMKLLTGLVLLATFVGVGLNYYWVIVSPQRADSTQLPQLKPHFVHPVDANCARVVGTSETLEVYLCRTVNDEYFYVRVTQATLMQEDISHPLNLNRKDQDVEAE